MSTVYHAPARASRWDYSASQIAGLERLIESLDFGEAIAKDDLVAIKTHFGERGGTAFVPVMYISRLVKEIKEQKGKPFVTDAGTLYVLSLIHI